MINLTKEFFHKTMFTMKISIIICTKNRMKDLINCLRSVLCQSLVPDEIIIIDSSSSKDDIGKLAEFINGINIIKYYYFNTSLTGARNIGVEEKYRGNNNIFG